MKLLFFITIVTFSIGASAGGLTCKDVDGKNKYYHSNMDKLASLAKLNGWYRNTEGFVFSLCMNDIKSADREVLFGGIQADEAGRVAKVLSINYQAPERSHSDILYEIANRKLAEYMCSACASNAALDFVNFPNSQRGKLIKQALDGNASAIKQVTSLYQ